MYAVGRGTAQNNFQAYVYLSAAVQSGVQAAKTPQERVGALLQPARARAGGEAGRDAGAQGSFMTASARGRGLAFVALLATDVPPTIRSVAR